MNLPRLLPLLLITLLLGSIIPFPTSQISEGRISDSTRIESSPISISGNSDLLVKKGVYGWSGNGTASDPVIIRDLEIDAEGGDHCLKMENISFHFVIENCTLEGATYMPPIGFPGHGTGLDITECSNGTVTSSRVRSNIIGISLDWCKDLRMTRNWVFNNMIDGIWIGRSFDITLDNSSIHHHSEGNGITAYDSPSVNIWDNRIWECYYAMSIGYCPNASVIGNEVYGDLMQTGLYIYASLNSSLLLNDISEADDTLLYLDFMGGTTVKGNYLHHGGEPARFIMFPNGKVKGNFIYANSDPLTIEYISSPSECDGLEIYENTFSMNNGADFLFNREHIQASDIGMSVKYYNLISGKGNHWTDWTSPDVDEDGVVDEEYEIKDGQNSDPYPLVSSPVSLADSPTSVEARVRDSDIRVSWGAVEPDYDLEILSYMVERKVKSTTVDYTSLISTPTAYYTERDAISGYTYSYSITAMTEAGLGDQSDEVSVTFDDSAPRIRMIEPTRDSAYNTSDLVFRWEVIEEETDVISTLISMDDDMAVEIGTNTSFPVQVQIPGYHTFEVMITNSVGLTDTVITQFLYDPDSPSLSLLDPERTYTYQDSTIIHWTMADQTTEIESVWIRIDGSAWKEITIDDQYTLPLESEGLTILEIMVKDSAGNTAAAIKEVIVDRQAPDAVIISPSDNGYLNSSSFIVEADYSDQGSGVSLVEIRLDSGMSMEPDENGQVAFSGIPEGRHQISLHVVDLAGNVKVERIDIAVDISEPYVVQYIPTGDQVSVDETIWITLSESVLEDTVRIWIEGVEGDMTFSGSQISFSPTDPLDHATDYTVILEGSDEAGNPIRDHSWTFTTTDVGFVRGMVLDQDGSPLINQIVNMQGLVIVKTDSKGIFNISYSMGSYELNITGTGYHLFNTSFDIEPGRTTDLGTIVLDEEAGDQGENDDPLMLTIAATVMVFVLLVFLIILFFYRRYQDKHTISEEDREQMLDILRHFDLSTKIDQVDAYETLGVGRNASSKEIRKAYRKLAARYHPDRMMHDDDYDEEEAHQKMGEINAAKNILLDEEKRDLQDRILRITGRY